MLRQIKIITRECRLQRGLSSGGSQSLSKLTVPVPLLSANHQHPALSSLLEYSGRRSVHQSCSLCGRYYESNPRGEYKNAKLDEQFEKVQREKLWGFKDGLKDLREEVAKWATEWKNKLGDDTHIYVTPGDTLKVWTFENKSTLQDWTTLYDAEHNEGFSKCELTISPTGKGLFHGFVNTTPPKDGRVKYAGYCMMKSVRPLKSFNRKWYHDWSDYTHLLLRVRGDGRTYMLNISTAGYYDITWNDVYHYVLFTRGGPYWQYVKIPFGRFCFGSKGRAQDMQEHIPLDRIASFQIGAAKVDGPFCLEIDYIGLENDPDKQECFSYEMYRIPKFIANV